MEKVVVTDEVDDYAIVEVTMTIKYRINRTSIESGYYGENVTSFDLAAQSDKEGVSENSFDIYELFNDFAPEYVFEVISTHKN